MNKSLIFFLIVSLLTIVGCGSAEKNEPITEKKESKVINKIDTTKQNTANLKVEDYQLSTTRPEEVKLPQIDKKWMITPGKSVGVIQQKSTLASVSNTYGKNNITKENVVTAARDAQGRPIRLYQTTLFKGGKNEAIIYWEDTINIQNPIQVRILGEAGDWATNKGVKVGTKLEYLLHANGKDFYFLGFDDTQYNGQFNGKVKWNKGRMPNSFAVSLEPSLISKGLDTFTTFQQLIMFPTNHPDVQSLGLFVREMRVLLKS